jgi:xanthine dehydrogenase YagS FAD-binding subunit
MEKLKQASVPRIFIERAGNRVRVKIFTARPGIVIGKKGQEVENMKVQLGKLTGKEVLLDIQEVKKPEIEAQLVAENVALQLERRITFRRAMKKAVEMAMALGAEGVWCGSVWLTTEEAETHPIVKEKFSILSTGAELAASPQIRNQGTIGGNVSQDARCHYYRAGWPCYRAGGNICYADTPTGRNREHAILDADRCVAVNPSDSAPALIALDAKFVIRTSKGERVVDAEDYFIGPDIDITHLNILRPGELLTAIRIPSTWAGSQFFFEKVRDRNVWDFALLNVASAMVVTGGNIERIRIAVNGAAARPLRLKSVEDAVRGKPKIAATGEMAGKLAVQGAIPLQFNAYKIPLMRNLVKRAVGGVEVATWA